MTSDLRRLRQRQHPPDRHRRRPASRSRSSATTESDFYQWFHFRALGVRGRAVSYEIANAGGSAFPGGWPGYRACWSEDRVTWRRVADTRLCRRRAALHARRPQGDAVWFAYFAPYSMERHNDLVARIAAAAGRDARLARPDARRPRDGLPDARRRPASRSGSTRASIPANRWPNGGWRARSRC